MRAKAALKDMSARLSQEFPTVNKSAVERAVLASWWKFDREADDQLRAHAAEWYARAALNALAELQPVKPA